MNRTRHQILRLPNRASPFWRAIAANKVPEAPIQRSLWHEFIDGSLRGIPPAPRFGLGHKRSDF